MGFSKVDPPRDTPLPASTSATRTWDPWPSPAPGCQRRRPPGPLPSQPTSPPPLAGRFGVSLPPHRPPNRPAPCPSGSPRHCRGYCRRARLGSRWTKEGGAALEEGSEERPRRQRMRSRRRAALAVAAAVSTWLLPEGRVRGWPFPLGRFF